MLIRKLLVEKLLIEAVILPILTPLLWEAFKRLRQAWEERDYRAIASSLFARLDGKLPDVIAGGRKSELVNAIYREIFRLKPLLKAKAAERVYEFFLRDYDPAIAAGKNAEVRPASKHLEAARQADLKSHLHALEEIAQSLPPEQREKASGLRAAIAGRQVEIVKIVEAVQG